MWALIQKKENTLPTMVNQSSPYFPDYIQSGYEILKEGTKRDMEREWDEMIVEFAQALD